MYIVLLSRKKKHNIPDFQICKCIQYIKDQIPFMKMNLKKCPPKSKTQIDNFKINSKSKNNINNTMYVHLGAFSG